MIFARYTTALTLFNPSVAGLGKELAILLYAIAHGSEQVSHQRAIEPASQCSQLSLLRESHTAACKAYYGIGQYETVYCDGTQDTLLVEQRGRFKRRAGDRRQNIDGYRSDLQLAQLKCQLYALLYGLAHTYNAARAYLHTHLARPAYGLFLLLGGMSAA